MATINGITLTKLRKFRDRDNSLLYKGELWLGEEKLADWVQGADGRDRLYPEEGIDRKKLMFAIKDSDPKKQSFENTMYDLASLTENERQFKMAKRYGKAGIISVYNSRKFCWQDLTKEEIEKDDAYFWQKIADVLDDFSQNGEKAEYTVYKNYSDFKLGESYVTRDQLLSDKSFG